MNDLNRRNLLLALPALSLLDIATAGAQQDAHATGVKGQNALTTDFSHCKAFPFESLPLRYSDAGAPTHDVLRGTIPTGELVELHETTVDPGKMPHPAHQHPHSEFIPMKEGTSDFTYQGQSHLLTAGSVGYTAPNELHGFENVGWVAATYFIFSVGKH